MVTKDKVIISINSSGSILLRSGDNNIFGSSKINIVSNKNIIKAWNSRIVLQSIKIILSETFKNIC